MNKVNESVAKGGADRTAWHCITVQSEATINIAL